MDAAAVATDGVEVVAFKEAAPVAAADRVTIAACIADISLPFRYEYRLDYLMQPLQQAYVVA